MLAHPNQLPTNFNLYPNKLIRIISPFSGEQFKIELGGKEEEFRELLATLLNIDSSYIKGLKDSYGNYYTLSSALNNLFIYSNENNLFSLVLNISSNKSNNKYNHYNESFDRNMLYNVNNNYHNRTEFNEIYIGNSNKKLMKSKSNYRYTTLIKELIPAINRNFRDEDDNDNESFYNEKWSLSRHPKFAKVLENLKKKFSKEQYKILKELLKMENITIINCFKLYEKSKDKKELIKSLNSLFKKYHKKIKKDSSSSDEDSHNIKSSKRTKKSKYSKQRSGKSDTSSESEESSRHIKKSNHKHHKKKETSSSSSQESKSSSQSKESDDDDESNTKNSEESEEEEENTEENKNNFPIKCTSLEDLIDNIKELFNNNLVVNCLFTNDIDFLKKTETQKTQLLKEEFNINNFTITKNAYEAIKNYYDDIMKKVIEKNMTEDERTLLHKLIKKKNKSIKLRFRALFRHNNYELLTSDLKECMKDYIKRKKGSEHKINLKKNNESISINSNSDSSNDNDNNENGEENYGDDNSSKSIRKNERMAKNNKKKNEQKSQISPKSKEEESIGQFKLMEMNDGSKGDSESKKSENFSKSRKSSSKIANEKDDENFENNFIPLIKKMKEDGSINITDNEVNILINEFNKKNKMLLAFIEEYQANKDQEEFNDSIETFIKDLYNKKVYTEGEPVNIIENNNENVDNIDNNKKNVVEEEQPYEKEVISGLRGLKFGKKGNKKIINILLKNNVFTNEQMRNIEEDLDQNNNFIVGAFELIYITMNVKDLVENINIRLHLSQSEKENQIKTNLDIIMKSFSEEEQNKVRELYEAKDANLMNILESEMNDIKKAKASILNFLEKN